MTTAIVIVARGIVIKAIAIVIAAIGVVMQTKAFATLKATAFQAVTPK